MTVPASERPVRDRTPRRWVGPRARRRIAWVTAALALVIIGGAANQLFRSGSSSPVRKSSSRQPRYIGAMNLGIAYGATAKQVLRQLGAPTSKEGNCWIYRGRAIAANRAHAGPNVDAMKFCFSEGSTGDQVVSTISSHYMATTFHNRRYPAHWGGFVTIMSGTPTRPSGCIAC